jgi:SWIB/MDM2 domain
LILPRNICSVSLSHKQKSQGKDHKPERSLPSPHEAPRDAVCNDCDRVDSNDADFRTAPFRLSLVSRVFRFREVNLTPTKKAFGGYGIELDSALATVLGGREGQKISPSEMTKRLWNYVKRNNLGKRN